MMRRYPVRSVLSERKMFSNGGMLPTSKPIESSMNQPSGILASSSPLIDAVSQEILAPMTGGAMPMAQGGVARFRNGGTIGLGQAPDADGGGPYSMAQIQGLLSLINPADRASYVQELASRGLIGGSQNTTAGQPGDVAQGSDPSKVDPRIAERLIGLEDARKLIQVPDLPEGESSVSVDSDLSSLLPDANRPTFEEELSRKNMENPERPRGSDPVNPATSTVDPRIAERIIELGKTREIVQDPGLPESGAMPPSTPSTVAEAVIEAAPPPTDMSFLPDFKSSVEEFNRRFGRQPQESEESGAMPPSTPSIGDQQFPDPDLPVGAQQFPDPDLPVGAQQFPDSDLPVGAQQFPDPDLPTSITEAINSSTASQAKDSTFNLSDWVKQNPDKSTETAPGDVVNNSIDSIFSDAFKSLEGKEFDVNKFKGEIEDLLPETKEDPQMEGLLVAMLGASIAGGTSENPFVNISNALTKSMPAIINFKTKQKDKKNARDMTVAKLAIQTKISRENENRSAIRAVEAQKRGLSIDIFKANEAARIAKDKEDRVTGNYMVVKNTTLPGNVFDPNASKDSEVTIPFNTKMNVTKGEAQRLQGMGIPLFEVGKPTFTAKDLFDSTTPTSSFKNLSPQDINRIATQKTAEHFKFGTDDGIKIDYFQPTPFGLTKDVQEAFMSNKQWAAVYLKYQSYRSKFEQIGDRLNVLYDTAKDNKLTGFDGLKQRIGDSARGLGAIPFAEQLGDYLLDNAKLSEGGIFDVNARLVLAEITPFILGESGKTISDADRVLVARSLGYEASLVDNVMSIEGLNKSLLTNPEQVKTALREVTGVINKYIAKGDNEMQTLMIKYNRVTDEETRNILETVAGPQDKIANIKKQAQKNMGKGPFVDLDLTKGL